MFTISLLTWAIILAGLNNYLCTIICRVHIWRDAFVGRRATHRYENLHLTQRLGWGIEDRARYSSYRGLFDVPASALSGRILRQIGVERSLMLGQVREFASTDTANPIGLSLSGLMPSLSRDLPLAANSNHGAASRWARDSRAALLPSATAANYRRCC